MVSVSPPCATKVVNRAALGRLREASFIETDIYGSLTSGTKHHPHTEPELERLYAQIVWEVIAMRVCLPSLIAKGDVGLLEQQGHRLLEKWSHYVARIEDHSMGSPPSPAERQRREKQWSYFLHKWKRLCAE